MPRTARIKLENGMYHIICKSITEVNLFKGKKDKIKYLNILKKYKAMYDFKLYQYCLMGNHLHLMIDCNGADISKIMKGINISYVKYYNSKYHRVGPLFKDRFKSILVTGEKHVKDLSLYIHNNPRDFKQFKDCPEKYPYSSLAYYLGLKEDDFGIIDKKIILEFFGETQEEGAKSYHRIILKSEYDKDKKPEADQEKTEYRSYRKALIRDFHVEKTINKILENYGLDRTSINIKNLRKASEAKAVCVLALRKLAAKTDREIAEIIGDITQARISQLCYKGLEIAEKDKSVKILFDKIIRTAA